jgi:hypothetical protein
MADTEPTEPAAEAPASQEEPETGSSDAAAPPEAAAPAETGEVSEAEGASAPTQEGTAAETTEPAQVEAAGEAAAQQPGDAAQQPAEDIAQADQPGELLQEAHELPRVTTADVTSTDEQRGLTPQTGRGQETDERPTTDTSVREEAEEDAASPERKPSQPPAISVDDELQEEIDPETLRQQRLKRQQLVQVCCPCSNGLSLFPSSRSISLLLPPAPASGPANQTRAAGAQQPCAAWRQRRPQEEGRQDQPAGRRDFCLRESQSRVCFVPLYLFSLSSLLSSLLLSLSSLSLSLSLSLFNTHTNAHLPLSSLPPSLCVTRPVSGT